jgi:hypothetical protein
MLNRLIRGQTSVPNLVVAQRVLHKMTAAAQTFIADETGEAMVGLTVPGTHTNGIPTLYVLDTISPDESAVRQMHTFQQGDERQDELIWWLQENWHAHREKHRGSAWQRLMNGVSKWDVPLRYLGDWHKQPGYMIQPSGGDLMTALDWIEDAENDMEFLLAPIVTLGHPHTIAPSSVVTNFLMIPQDDQTAIRVDFWYIDRKVQMFLPISPTVYPDDQLPTLPPYPWHLVDDKRLTEEHSLMERDGLFTSLTLWDTDGDPPLEVCFLTARMGGSKMIIVVTPHDYPNHPPRARLAPFVQLKTGDDMYAVFKSAWEAAETHEYRPDGAWTPESHLIDFIHQVEQKAGLRSDNPRGASEAEVSS